jgi:hypothetical protein
VCPVRREPQFSQLRCGDWRLTVIPYVALYVCLSPSCVVQDDGSGCLLSTSGIAALKWNVNGEVMDDKLATATLPPGCTFDLSTGVFRQVWGEALGVLYNIQSRALELYMSVDGIKHCFVQGFNPSRVCERTVVVMCVYYHGTVPFGCGTVGAGQRIWR